MATKTFFARFGRAFEITNNVKALSRLILAHAERCIRIRVPTREPAAQT